MANATIIYACAADGLAILNKPGTLPEWLPPRRALNGRVVRSAWGEPGPPIRVLAVAGGDLLLSENGGRTWEAVGGQGETAGQSPVTSLFCAGEPEKLYAGTQAGDLLASQDAGVTWNRLPMLPLRGDVLALFAGRTVPELFFLLQQQDGDNALFKGNPQNGQWQPLPAKGVTAIAQDAASGMLYAGTNVGVRVSDDAGTSWLPLVGSPHDGLAILAIPGATGKPASLVAGTASGLQVSPDGGETWQGVKLPQAGAVSALAHDPERRDRLYAATHTGYLFESGNRGQSWQAINMGPLPAVSYLYVVRI